MLRASYSSLLLGAELVRTSLEARSRERGGGRDAVVGTYLPVRNRAVRQQPRRGRSCWVGEELYVRVKGFGVEDNVGGSEDSLVAIAVEGVVRVGSAGHVAAAGGGIGGRRASSHPWYSHPDYTRACHFR